MTKIISAILLLCLSAFLVFNETNIQPSVVFEKVSDIFSSGDMTVDLEEDVVSDVEENIPLDVPADVPEATKPILPGNQVRTTIPLPSSRLTNLGVFIWTNNQRSNNGELPLVSSVLLDAVAESKLNDMFKNQYFAHEASNGDQVGDLAEQFGYKYLLIGENLAYGDFKNDEALVEAWMDSPGHRENILNGSYTELGVAVGRGVFEGRETWLAVQSFGAPYSLCDIVDESLLQSIEDGRDELKEREAALTEMREDIESTYPKSGPEYNEKVNTYNALVNEYNNLIKEVNSWVKIYNDQVAEFKDCAESI